ncbi:hypothetical protein D3C71_1743830 [compost metagenome]
MDQVGPHAIGSEWIEYRFVPERRGVVTPQTKLSESAREADRGTAGEGREALLTIVIADRCFEPEARCQTATEVFGPSEAETAAVVA